MRFRADDDISEPLAFELGDDWGDGGSDVSFGSARSGGPPRRWQLAGGAAAVAAVLGGALFLGRGGDEAAAPDTTVVVPTTAAPRPSTTPARPRRSTTTTVPVPYTPPAAFATDPGWDIYLVRYTSSSQISVFDPTTGSLEIADLPTVGYEANGNGQVVRGPDGPVELTYGDFGIPAPLPDGTAWFWDGGDVLVRRSLGVGDELERITLAPGATAGQLRGVLGTTAEGRPAVWLPDGRMYGVQPDGTLQRITDVLTFDMRLGQYSGVVCSEAGSCTRVLHGLGGEIEVPAGATQGDTLTEFSPTGAHAAVIDIDYAVATVQLAVYDLANGATIFNELTSAGFNGGVAKWSPDGRYLITVFDGDLIAIDVQTGGVTAIPTPGALDDRAVAGVL